MTRTRRDTAAVHAGRGDLATIGAHVPPIDLSTTYPLPNVDGGGASYEQLATGRRPDDGSLVYQRLWNPTVGRFEAALAELEGCAEAVAFATGMAAVSASLLAAVLSGRPHIVAVRPLYGGTDHLLASGLLGTDITWAEPHQVAEAIRPSTGLVVVETPANPSVELVDLADVTEQAGQVAVLVDNTFATPVLQQPAAHGATLVLHSATKFIGGHGDTMGGVVATTGEWAARLRRVRAVTGGLLHPMAAYELHRGLQTLPVRVRTAQASAEKVAGWLAAQPEFEQVYFPGLAECDPRGLVGRQMSGPGTMLAFTVRDGYDAAARIAQSCRLITHAVSLGGVGTLIQHPASLTHRPVADEAKPPAALLRLSIGLESVEDILADLSAALRRAGSR